MTEDFADRMRTVRQTIAEQNDKAIGWHTDPNGGHPWAPADQVAQSAGDLLADDPASIEATPTPVAPPTGPQPDPSQAGALGGGFPLREPTLLEQIHMLNQQITQQPRPLA